MKNYLQNIILFLGLLLTSGLFYFFINISIEKSILTQELASIATTIGGFASALAFLWIIITVILQSFELSLQRKEMTELKQANLEQANALKYANKINLLAYSNIKRKEISPRLKELVEINNNGLIDFLEKDSDTNYYQGYHKNFRNSIKTFMYSFLTPNVPEEIKKEIKSMEDLVSKIPINPEYDFGNFIILQTLLSNMEEVWQLASNIYELYFEIEQTSEYFDWEVQNGIINYSISFKELIILKNRVDKFNHENKKGNELYINLLNYEKDNRDLFNFNYKEEDKKVKQKKYFGINKQLN
jgi:hypothetical protein